MSDDERNDAPVGADALAKKEDETIEEATRDSVPDNKSALARFSERRSKEKKESVQSVTPGELQEITNSTFQPVEVSEVQYQSVPVGTQSLQNDIRVNQSQNWNEYVDQLAAEGMEKARLEAVDAENRRQEKYNHVNAVRSERRIERHKNNVLAVQGVVESALLVGGFYLFTKLPPWGKALMGIGVGASLYKQWLDKTERQLK